MNLKDKIKEIVGINNDLIEKFLEYNQIGSIFNFLEDAINQIDDDILSRKFKDIQNHIQQKREEIGNTEIKNEVENE